MIKNRGQFDGLYFKHQKNNFSLAFIPGISGDEAFIQVISTDISYYFSYPREEYKNGRIVKVGSCEFSTDGILIDIEKDTTSIKGSISYTGITPLKYDIMGIFKYFPMECRHGIISMYHSLNGQLDINGRITDFSGGVGYIEKDSGVSFPKSYLWLQCTGRDEKCSVSVSVADIPFAGIRFKGCICAVYYKNTEYRLATYLGVRIVRCDNKKIILKQGKYLLDIDIYADGGQKLIAPANGAMNRTVTEAIACGALLRFYEGGKLLFHIKSDSASFEYAGI